MILQLQAFTDRSIDAVVDGVRRAVGRACGGVDDMQLLGKKALVVTAEICPERIEFLGDLLADLAIVLPVSTMPNLAALEPGREYPVTLQVVSHAVDTDGRVKVPAVPG